MKKSIVLSALVLVLGSASVFAADKTTKEVTSAVSINGLKSDIGVAVSVTGELSDKAIVEINDSEGTSLYKTGLSNHAGTVKGFNLSQLDNGDYTITVTTGRQELKKQVHIYDEAGKKTYFIVQ